MGWHIHDSLLKVVDIKRMSQYKKVNIANGLAEGGEQLEKYHKSRKPQVTSHKINRE